MDKLKLCRFWFRICVGAMAATPIAAGRYFQAPSDATLLFLLFCLTCLLLGGFAAIRISKPCEELPKLGIFPWSNGAAAILAEPAIAMLYASVGGAVIAVCFLILTLIYRDPSLHSIAVMGGAFLSSYLQRVASFQFLSLLHVSAQARTEKATMSKLRSMRTPFR